MNENTLTRLGFSLILIGVVLFFVSKGQFVMAAVVTAAIPVMTLAHSPAKWWMAAVVFANSGLRVPGVPGGMTVSLVASAGFIGLMLLEKAFSRNARTAGSVPQCFALAVTILLVGLASYRGWGLRFFGGSSWGGMQYVQLIIGLLFFSYTRHIKLSEKQAQRMIFFYFALALVPTAITFITRYIPAMSVLSYIVNFQDLGAEGAVRADAQVSRIGFVSIPAVILGYWCLFLFDRDFKISAKVMGVGFLALLLAGLSGHRVALVRIGLAAIVYAVLRWRKIPPAIRTKAVVTGLVLLASVYIFSTALPLGVQRTFSILPGIRVDAVAARDAEGTSEWRVEMWRKMLPMIPEYLLIGRGMGYDLREAYGAFTLNSDKQSQHAFFIATHTYHNGPLWAVIDLGGTGAVLLAGLLVTALVRYGRRLSRSFPPTSGAIYVVFYAMLVSQIITFVSVYGGKQNIVSMAMLLAVLEVVSKNSLEDQVASDSKKLEPSRASCSD